MRWNATEGGGEAEKTAWEALLKMEKLYETVEEIDQGAAVLVVDLAKTFDTYR